MIRLASIVTALLIAPIASAQDVPFTGVVVEDSVQARAGAGRAYYVVGDLKRGDLVRVEEVIFGWNRIAAPEGVHSYISKAFVDVEGDGRTGTVNTDRTDVKAGSVKGPGESYRAQVVLNKGDTVKVLDEAGSFYKIEPPKGASVFIPPGSVRRADAMEEARAQPKPEPAKPEPAKPQPTPVQPEPAVEELPGLDVVEETPSAEVEQTIVEAVEETPTETAIEVEATEMTEATEAETAVEAAPAPPVGESPEGVSIDVDSEKLQAVEDEIGPMFILPLEDQDLDMMAAAYEQARDDQSLTAADELVINRRLAAIERNRVIKDAVMATATARVESEEREQQSKQPPGPVTYDAVGRLMASSVYNGVNLPRMFRIVNPNGARTIAYVKPGQVDAGIMLGKIVGVVGVTSYDPSTKLNIIDVKRIDVLDTPQDVE